MKTFTRKLAGLTLGLAGAALIGCAQEVDQADVSDARDDVTEEMRETEQTREDVRRDVAEKEREAESIRHEVMKPNSEEVREAEQEVEEARIEGEQKINEEEQETRKAQQKLADTDARLTEQKVRDAFVTDHEAQIVAANRRIEELETLADSQEGTAKETTDAEIESIEAARDQLVEAIEDVKSVDVLKWESEKQDVITAREQLDMALKAASAE